MSDTPLDFSAAEDRPGPGSRLWFGICLVLCLTVFFLAASLWLYVNEAKRLRMEGNATAGRLLVDQVMLLTHWNKLEAQEQFRATLDDLAKRLADEPCQWEVIMVDQAKAPGPPRDEFEKGVLDLYVGSKPASPGVWEYSDRVVGEGGSQRYKYYQPIRAQESCLAMCHRRPAADAGLPDARPPASLGRSTPTAPGELMAIVKVTF